MRKESKDFLVNYLNSNSPVGHEQSGQRVWLDYVSKYVDKTDSDVYGTAYGIINPSEKYKVVIEAHADEISWMVKYISDDGYIYVCKNGGSDASIAPSKRVNIFGDKGVVKGVFGWIPIHISGKRDIPKPSPDNIFIDCGCTSKSEVLEMGVHVGTIVTFDDDTFDLGDKFIVSRALDNRLGGFIIAEVVRKLKKNNVKLPYSLYVVNSVQEEIGLRGAQMIANTIKPDVAICTDVCHDVSAPLYDKKLDGDTVNGLGPVLTYAAPVHNNLLNKIIEVANKNEIPFQRYAANISTGTDTDSFAYSNGGVPSALVSVPVKYIHTTVETANYSDIKQAINLIYKTLLEIEVGENFSYLKQ